LKQAHYVSVGRPEGTDRFDLATTVLIVISLMLVSQALHTISSEVDMGVLEIKRNHCAWLDDIAALQWLFSTPCKLQSSLP
jgi:hypothetical protein